MLIAASFDESRKLPLYARINETGAPILLTFLNADETPHPITDYDFEARFKQREFSTTYLFTLTVGSGLTIEGDALNVLRFDGLTEEQATQKVDTNFWTLFSVAQNRTKLNGSIKFHEGEFDSFVNNSEIKIGNNEITIIVTGGISDGSSELPDGVLINCGRWDLSTDVVPQTGGTGTAGAIKNGNRFYIEIGSSGGVIGPDGGPVIAGFIAEAQIDTPGINLADTDKWLLIPTIT